MLRHFLSATLMHVLSSIILCRNLPTLTPRPEVERCYFGQLSY